ncbi:MAG: hypothetical protein LBM93_06610 [Oscillospiraceae bacterium]|jgi:rRNA maturation endonuclease Nob1|nr:hypothetical protein [Oscillospiraceae bacterium]
MQHTFSTEFIVLTWIAAITLVSNITTMIFVILLMLKNKRNKNDFAGKIVCSNCNKSYSAELKKCPICGSKRS